MSMDLPSVDPQPLAPGEHRTDAFHRQPLFAVNPLPRHSGPLWVVRLWNEAHALHGPVNLDDVNPAYVAALISNEFRADVAPYRRIRRLPLSHHVLIDSAGDLHASPYDPLAGGAGPMDPPALDIFLRQGLLHHVQRRLEGHHGLIGCEHSSGLDSNAVLGALRNGLGLPPERLHTWSNEGNGEGLLLQRFRLFHQLSPQHCHCLIPTRGTAAVRQVADQLALHLRLLGAPAQINGAARAAEALAAHGCTLVFSGFGGDQAISHNAANVPSDLVAQGRWLELLGWMGSRRCALKTAAIRGLAVGCRPFAERVVLRRTRAFVRSDLLQRSLTAAGRSWLGLHLQNSYPWEIDGFVRQHVSIRRRVLAPWVAVRVEEETRLAAAYGLAKAFPLLDEHLIATLLQQDPALFGEGVGRGRLLHRRAFAPFLPPELRDSPSKDRIAEDGFEQRKAEIISNCRDMLEHQLVASRHWHPALSRWWDLAAIREEAETFANKPAPTLKETIGTSKALVTLARLSGWWEALDG